MKKHLSILVLSLLLTGCATNITTQDNNQQTQDQKKIHIVTSFYPLAEIAKQVGGDYVDVKNIVPAGAEPHDYEPTPQDIIALNQAQLVIFNGAGLEPWTDKTIPDLEKNGIQVINESQSFNLEKNNPNEGNTDESLPSTLDPHIWLDPLLYSQEVQNVADKLELIDPSHKLQYEQNAENFEHQLASLNNSYQEGLKTCKFRSFVTNHAAFGYLSNRYHLEMISIAGLSPDAEPSPKTLAALTDLLKQKGIKYILVETLVSPKVAQTLAEEVGAQTLVLNPLEGLSDEELAQGKNYISVMKENLKNLQTALECE